MRSLARQFGGPSGPVGHLVSGLLARGNSGINCWLVRELGTVMPAPATIIELGCGPGIALRELLAAYPGTGDAAAGSGAGHLPAGPDPTVSGPCTAPACYLGRPAWLWMTAIRLRRRRPVGRGRQDGPGFPAGLRLDTHEEPSRAGRSRQSSPAIPGHPELTERTTL
jgi:hypothetical protein